MAEFDNAELLTDIRERGGLPSADLRFTDTKLLAAASLELRDVVSTLLVESQTDRCVYVLDVAVSAGVSTYRLPSRALAGRWQSVAWQESGGATWTRLKQMHSEDYYRQSSTAQAPPSGFFVRDYALVLVPTPNSAGTLRLPYYLRPSTLVLPSATAVVSALNGSVATLASMPPAFTPGASYDVVRGTPGFETLVQNRTAALTGSTLTFTGSLPTDTLAPAVGDYICLAGQSPFAQCPVEVRGLLAARAARRALKAVGASEQAAMLDADVAELTEVARTLLAPRVDAEPQEWGDSNRGLLSGVLR